ncbi:MAG: phosphate transport system regulatory protein PhoU [Rhodobacterales bacterium]|nr:MAG: phosphate transport system regulatory protein PhoU [Rhodobacterales bacterium]
MNEQHHITSAFDRDLESVQAKVMKMGGLVEDSIRKGSRALKRLDIELGEQVRREDRAIDALDEEINLECARILAIRQPAASDLRTVLSVMHISSNLERIGDYAKNMGKRTGALAQMPQIEGSGGAVKRMAKEVQHMLADALDAYIRRDEALAQDVRHRDLEVDQMYNALFREFLTFMMEDPRSISACMHLHFIAKNIERMGDHVTAIADQAIYLVTGDMPDEARPKGNAEPYQVPEDAAPDGA